jgi:hypothetical protein
MTSRSISLSAITPYHLIEALAAVALGVVAYVLIRKRSLSLSEGLFRIEQGPLIILGGFFVVYALMVLGQ